MSTIIINGKELQSVEWRNEYVMTTETLAYFFEVSTDSLKKNFANNRDRFIEGRHFFKIEGDDLQRLAKDFPQALNKFAPKLYLWTRRGVARHAKMSNSDVAWEIFEMLEDAYFNREIAMPTQPGAPFMFELGRELRALASHTRNPLTREMLVSKAANCLLGEDTLQTESFWVPSQRLSTPRGGERR